MPTVEGFKFSLLECVPILLLYLIWAWDHGHSGVLLFVETILPSVLLIVQNILWDEIYAWFYHDNLWKLKKQPWWTKLVGMSGSLCFIVCSVYSVFVGSALLDFIGYSIQMEVWSVKLDCIRFSWLQILLTSLPTNLNQLKNLRLIDVKNRKTHYKAS